MSGNAGPIDARIARTRERLGDALVALLQEKEFDTITVQQVLDRAGVGRSTFYVHYRDKEDLFLSDVDEFLEAMSTLLSRQHDASTRVAPVRELFAHVGEGQKLYQALVASGRIRDFLALAQGHFARAIEQRLGERGATMDKPAVLANALAGALLSLLTSWMDRGRPESPAEMDDLFHRLVWSGSR